MKIFNESLKQRCLVFDIDTYKLKRVVHDNSGYTCQIFNKDVIVLCMDLSKAIDNPSYKVSYKDLIAYDEKRNVISFNIDELLSNIKSANKGNWNQIYDFLFNNSDLEIDKNVIKEKLLEFKNKYNPDKELIELLVKNYVEHIDLTPKKTMTVFNNNPVKHTANFGDNSVEIMDIFYTWNGKELKPLKVIHTVTVSDVKLLTGRPLKERVPKDSLEIIRVFTGKHGIKRSANGIILEVFDCSVLRTKPSVCPVRNKLVDLLN